MSPDAPFEAIRPYSDEELPGVLDRLRSDSRLLNAMLRFRAPLGAGVAATGAPSLPPPDACQAYPSL